MKQLFLLFFLTVCINKLYPQFTKLPSGIEYRIVKKGNGTQTPKVGDYVAMILKGSCSGQIIFDTKKFNKGVNAPVNFPYQKKKTNSDIMEVIALLHEGDSAVIHIPQDSFYRMPQAQRKGILPSVPVIYTVGIYSIKNAAQLKKMQDDYKKAMANIAKQQAVFKKQQEQQAAVVKQQDAEIIAYLLKNNIKNVIKLPSGVYYALQKEGNGNFIKPGYEVTMNYNMQILNGKKFDSNIDTVFNHVIPAKALVQKHQLLAGWDEGILKFKKGSKGTIFIPSDYAYGSNKYGVRPNDTIPPNSIIKIDAEILDVADVETLAKNLAKKDDSLIQAYLLKEKLQATKTNSGLYYIITQEGVGALPTTNDEITMNYTGMFLDGTKFDSNTDSSFKHVTPFTFKLGKGQVIKGWDEAVALLKKGSKAKIILPSAIAYGANGGGTIPPNTVLQFDVEMVDFKKSDTK